MISPAHLQAQLIRAQSLQQSGRAEEAWAAIAPLRSAIDSHGQALRLFALIAQAAGRIDAAAEALARIIRIEREPPEIVGALADMLGNAGRHDEALAQWTRLAALKPDVADAHLNRAISAVNAGKPAIAIQAAEAGLARFPDHPRLLAALAMALKNDGRTEESLAAFERAIRIEPDRALTRHNHAVALRAARRFEEACEAFAESRRLGMSGADFHANWAASTLEAGDAERAAELYEMALAANPGHDEAMRALTRLHIEYRTGKDPFGHYGALAASSGNDVQPWLSWADALASNGRYADAAEVAERGLERHSADPMLPIVRAFSAGMAGEPGAPAAELEARLRQQPNNPLLWAMLSQLGLRAGRPDLASEAAQLLVTKTPDDQSAWSILSIAWRLLDDPREQWLCDYDRLVMTVPVVPPDQPLSAEAYAQMVSDALRPLHSTLEAPGNQSLRNGTQTSGALFDIGEPEIQRFRRSVSEAAASAVAALPDDPRHPFLSRKATSFAFSGSWSVRLRAGGGQHVPHFHSEGWMSSAYYAELPARHEEDGDHAGWIEFGRPPPIFQLDLPPRRLVKPEEGLLVLFPSYLWHGTVPFAAGERLTAAFDFMPLRDPA